LFVRSDEIWVQPIDGREPYVTGITSSNLFFPSVSPDGGRIAFRGRQDNQKRVDDQEPVSGYVAGEALTCGG
jgi:Tol biopolymer transport system component